MLTNSNDKKLPKEVVVSKGVKDYSKEPFFIQQAEASKKVIEKYGLPEHFICKKVK